MATHQQTHENDGETGTVRRFLLYGFMFVVIFALSVLATVAWKNRALISTLIYQSGATAYAEAKGESDVATFYVFHDDFDSLEKLAQQRDDILGIEATEFSGVAAMAFSSLDAEGIELIKSQPSVINMLQQNISMLCH